MNNEKQQIQEAFEIIQKQILELQQGMNTLADAMIELAKRSDGLETAMPSVLNGIMYSWNGNKDSEVWGNGQFISIEECIENAKGEGYKTGDEIFIGRCVEFEVNIDADDVIERLQEQAYEECGEASDGWIDWKNDNVSILSERLTRCVNEWLKETNQEPYFYYITDIKSQVVK